MLLRDTEINTKKNQPKELKIVAKVKQEMGGGGGEESKGLLFFLSLIKLFDSLKYK